ncbi:Pro-Pol polyprotein [Vitis vinifera]|uniref:Pro-Pol polyprotein n=1 Tax=Vitis vinifera TaxID=29760 RepID=A0A438IMY7_VITVI|nr:Pro-Pol polyprotein [Vitis vinifera]
MEAPRLFFRRADGCVPSEGTIASARDLLKSTHIHLEPPSPCRSTDTFSLGSTSWIRVGGRLIRVSDQLDQRLDQRDMDSQIVTVDQFAEAMASIQEAIASLGRRIDGQQAQQVPPPVGAQYDPTVPPPPPPSQSAPQAMPFTLHSQTGVAPPPITVPTPTSEDPHARMDRLEQGLRQLRASDRATTWEGFDGVPVASLPAKFRMPDIERYTGIGCPRLHLRLYSTVMRAHGLDEPQMITLFPPISEWGGSALVCVSGVLETPRELEALRQRTEESVSSFISRWRGKIAEIIDRPSERDQIQMVLRSLQPWIARHVVGAPFTDFRSLVMALYDVEDGISRGLWTDSSPSDVKGKKPFVGQRSTDVSAISSSSLRPLRRHQPIPQFPEPHSSYASHQYRPRAPRPAYDQTYTPQTLALPYYASQGIERPPVSYTATGQPCYAAQFTTRPAAPYPRPRAQQTFAPFALRAQRQFSQIGMPLSQALRKLTEAGLLTTLTPRPPPQPIPPQFRMDLHCAYHQGPGHETDRCTTLRHAVQDLIDQGLVHLGQPSVTTNPLPAHTTHAVPPPADDIHFLEFDGIDDHIHMLSDDDSDPEPIMPDVIYETSGVTLGPRKPAPFRLVPEAASVQAATVEPLILPHYSVQTPFILIPDVEGVQAPYVDDSQTLDIQYEEVRVEDDEILRQLQSTQARISIWSLLASSSTHRDALTRALSQIRVDTTSTPKGLIHMMTAGRATCIVFSDDDLPPEGSGHTRPLYISVGCSGRRVPSVLLDNGSALNVCPLATAIALGYAPSDFGPSTQTVRAYDNTRREVMGTLEIELLIGPTTFITIFQVLRIPTSFNLLLGRPWIHRAGAIPSSLHQKVKFIHEGQVVVVQSAGDMFISAEPVLQISHSDDDLLLTGFTFDEVQTLEMGDFCRDFIAMSFDQHGSTVVLDIMRGMSYLPGMGLGRRQHGPSEFITIPDHDVPFGLGFIPTEVDYRYMARLRKERARARLTHTPFEYPLRPYTRSLFDYFVRASESHAPSDGIIGGLSTTQEAELQRLVQQLQLSDGAPGPSASVLIAPPSPDRTSLMTLCFPDEIDDHGTFTEIGDVADGAVPRDEYVDEMLAMSLSQTEEMAPPELASPFDLFGVSVLEIAEEIQVAPTPEAVEDVIVAVDLFDGPVGLVEGASDLVVDILPRTTLLSMRLIQGEWKTRDVKLKPYHAYLELLVGRFDDLRYTHLPRAQNQFADALATLASMIDIPVDATVRPLLIESRSAPAYCCLIDYAEPDDGLPWYHDIYHFLRLDVYPEAATAKDKRALRQLATRFVIYGEALYRRSPDGMLLLCLDRTSADRVMREVHAGVCGPHMGGHMLARKIMRTGYFWLTMETDCCQFVQRCPECQIHGDLIHVPPSELHALTSPWPFSVWGIDIIGKISPKSSSGHEFILVAINYFTKWVEAASYARLTSSGVASFIRSHIICRYGVPHELISDRGVHFRAEVDTLVQRYSIRHHRSSAYRPQTNGAVEAANKNIKRILRRMVEASRDWRHTYSLVYGMEAMLPVEIEMGSLRVALEQQIPKAYWAQARFDQLNLLDERRLRAADHVRAYQRKMARAFKKRVKPRPLQIGDLVLKVIRGLIRDPRGKFRPNWSGPYFIRELTPEGAAWLMDLDGNRFSEPTNVDQLKRYYV